MIVPVILVFGICGTLTLGALDKSQTVITNPATANEPLIGNAFGFAIHFLQETVRVLTVGVDNQGTPYHSFLLSGLGLTITFCFLTMPLALICGLVLALMSRSPLRILRVPARAYVEFFRNTPFLVQMLAIYYGLAVLPHDFVDPFTVGLAALVLNYAAYECENLRAGIAALDKGQGEAAATLGLSGWQTLRLIIIPQMIPVVLPPVINDMIYLFKDSSILSLITIQELTLQTQNLARRVPSNSWQFYLIAAVIYLLLSLPLGKLARVAETRIKSAVAAPKRDLTVVALQIFAAMIFVGWVCGLLTAQDFRGNAIRGIGQLFAGVGLLLTIGVVVMVVLGALVYLPSTAFILLRGRGKTGDRKSLVAISK
jgi:His/Glu/Gln/Arg/opine family amino acid ABC transporter permease subunit